VTKGSIIFRIHAVQRMFERCFSEEGIRYVLDTGETIENYPDDIPYPSRLILGRRGLRPVHIVVVDNNEDNEIILITVYEPDSRQWKVDFRRRKK
jgi:hypothetical protein